VAYLNQLEAGDVVEWGIEEIGESRQKVVTWQPTAADMLALTLQDERLEKAGDFCFKMSG
jgi:hypothetical protein